MDPSVSALIALIKQQDLSAVSELYAQSSSLENIAQLKFLYHSAQQNAQVYSFYQDLCTQLCKTKPLPQGVIAGINDQSRLTFFTPALKFNNGFSLINEQGNTALHILFSNPQNVVPPFNYIRSLLLFESNEGLTHALKLRNNQQLTTIECYFAYNPHFNDLPAHEFSAVLALIEAQTQLLPQQPHVLTAICHKLKSSKHVHQLDERNHRILLLASTYQVSTSTVCGLLK
ncbi:hypothetical protein PCIT_a1285 [Pseudoalteromonas citrea]|uniref:Orphan protein n=2 Tax=Pseudoalteromonas citrea TaxID=43655 RepID=A0AAD4AM14_9GAMM|nr:hypothetical protein [Pseudoalteromonas citrea]KAF7775161.1 hypothetical protein PCIT_a1285 [Pseudoalteromonas citrea]